MISDVALARAAKKVGIADRMSSGLLGTIWIACIYTAIEEDWFAVIFEHAPSEKDAALKKVLATKAGLLEEARRVTGLEFIPLRPEAPF